MYKPIFIEGGINNIYDIFINDNNYLIIILPYSGKAPIIKYIGESIIPFILKICPHRHTYIYISDRKVEYEETITLEINENKIETRVNKYPEFKDEIIMSTLVKNEDNYIRQWIKFHLNIGINRFIIYDNVELNQENNDFISNLENVLKDYIEKEIVVLIKWIYPYRNTLYHYPGACQQTQQNHSIYAFQNSKYIGLFDIDEYVNIQNEITNISNFFTNLIKEENININDIGSFRLLNKFFYNPDNLPTNDYEFLKIYNCNENITFRGHEKNFIIPKNVNTFSVHMITSGKPMYIVDSKKIYFNHYYYLNKESRGRDKTSFIDNSICRHINNL